MAAQRLRCVAFAYQPFGSSDIPTAEEECDLILLAVVGLEGRRSSVPLHVNKPGHGWIWEMQLKCRILVARVINEVQSCIDAGVKVKMVTGDSHQTAIAIATECKILSQADAVEPNIIEGSRFRAMSQLEREDISEKILADIGLVMGMKGT